MPDHYTNQLIIFPRSDEETLELPNWGEILSPYYGKEAKCLLDEVRPMPTELRDTSSPRDKPNWYDWACENWGTKWGLYDASTPIELPGDSYAWQWSFATAWSPPNPTSRIAIIERLKSMGASSVFWVGVSPYNDSIELLTQHEN